MKGHMGSTGLTDVSAGNLDSRALSQVVQVLKDRQHLVVIDALVKAALLHDVSQAYHGFQTVVLFAG